MPTKIKVVVSILTVLTALVTSYFEYQTGSNFIRWFVVGLGMFMALSLWMFPEPKSEQKEGSQKSQTFS